MRALDSAARRLLSAWIGHQSLHFTVRSQKSSAAVVMASKKSFSGFTFTHAITRQLPSSFADQSLKMDLSQQIQNSLAAEQLAKYENVLKQRGLEVIRLPADEKYPDCVFVEDAALVIGNKACITNPGHPSRKGEVDAIKKALQDLGLEVFQMDDPSAHADGGDILFTGQEIFIGNSSRSNEAAARYLQKVFPEYPVASIPVSGTLHLKSVATIAQDGIIVVSKTTSAQQILKHIESKAQGKYKFLRVEDDKSANVVFINGYTVIKPESEIGAADFKALTSGLTVPWVATEFAEFYKADGCLSCCSLLIDMSKAK